MKKMFSLTIAIYLHGCRDTSVKIHFYFLFRHSYHLITSILRSKKRLQVIFVYPAAKVIYLLPDE